MRQRERDKNKEKRVTQKWAKDIYIFIYLEVNLS